MQCTIQWCKTLLLLIHRKHLRFAVQSRSWTDTVPRRVSVDNIQLTVKFLSSVFPTKSIIFSVGECESISLQSAGSCSHEPLYFAAHHGLFFKLRIKINRSNPVRTFVFHCNTKYITETLKLKPTVEETVAGFYLQKVMHTGGLLEHVRRLSKDLDWVGHWDRDSNRN